MQGYIARRIERRLRSALAHQPAVCLIGPRQCGKSTLAQRIIGLRKGAVYLDLERAADARKLSDPEAFLQHHRGRLVCLDEIQRLPDIFLELRGAIDRQARSGQFLLLGSASPDLLRQTAESLAGRLTYLELTPLLISEVGSTSRAWRRLWLRGGYPRSYLARALRASFDWRVSFIETFVGRDVPLLADRTSPVLLSRLFSMCAHLHGQLLNLSQLGDSLGVSHHTVRSYLELLARAFLIRLLEPCHTNLRKRLTKSPKLYLRDCGLLHALLDIETDDDLLGHPVRGPSFEGFVIEQVIASWPDWRPSFLRSQDGAEIDLVMEKGRRRVAFECKASSAPKLTRGTHQALEALGVEKCTIVAAVDEPYPLGEKVVVVPPHRIPSQPGPP